MDERVDKRLDERMGGAADRVRLVDVRDTPLDPAEVLAAVCDAAAGGINLFVGTVREQDHGDAVAHLEYSSHPTVVVRLHDLAAEIAEQYDVVAIAALHRVGVLGIGDIAVVSAVAAAHRGSAFEASRVLIDRLKAEVPIWKHQLFADGAEEWVDHA